MTILNRRVARLETAVSPGSRLLVVSGPVGFNAAAALASRAIVATAADMLIAINKPVGAPVTVIRGA